MKFIFFFLFSNGGSDKQHMDSSSDSDMDAPMHESNKSHVVSNLVSNNNNNHNSHSLSVTASSSNLTAQTLQMQLTAASAGSHHAQQLAPSASSLLQSATSAGSSKNLGQLSSSALSAVAYSHLHSVMGNMPIYDMSDYQHL